MAAKSPAKFPAQTGAQTPSPSLKRNLVFERFAAWEEAGLCERLVDSTRTAYDSAMRRFEAKLAKLPSLEGKEFLAMSVLGIDLDGKGNTDKALKIPQIGDYLQRFFQVVLHPV